MKNLIPITAGITLSAFFTESTHIQNISISVLVASNLNDGYQHSYSAWPTHPNAMDTEQASSLIQTIHKNVVVTGYRFPLFLALSDKTILQSMGGAFEGAETAFWQAHHTKPYKYWMNTRSGG